MQKSRKFESNANEGSRVTAAFIVKDEKPFESFVSTGENLGSIGSSLLFEAPKVVETANKGLYVNLLVEVGRGLAFTVLLVGKEGLGLESRGEVGEVCLGLAGWNFGFGCRFDGGGDDGGAWFWFDDDGSGGSCSDGDAWVDFLLGIVGVGVVGEGGE
ncbi:Hypothetical predicted protein [Olea europaea subsp. europaea]|uniref:Uncharacterized protein n=1 Tax=Olea europaea subsp. europaea TaxID=158383 RepID=A0A8S0UGZ0_OLEEU|nr:Hypothetical predicted protein [Olea europaea subsp. europaea]